MIKLILLAIFLLMGSYSLRADEVAGEGQDYLNGLDNIKNPFEDGIPKPVVVVQKPIEPPVEPPKPVPVIPKPKPKPAPQPVIVPPSLSVQGVIVGEDIHQAIINGQVMSLGASIDGARVISVTKKGVVVLFKGKKFFFKVE